MRTPLRFQRALAFLATAALSACGNGDDSSATTTPPATSVSIEVLSSRPDTVSDGAALLAIKLGDETALSNLKVMAGSQDVSSAFAKRPDGRVTGLVTGMGVGTVNITASISGTAATASLALKNYNKNGPIFSGAQQMPWICQTGQFSLPDGTMLGPPVDANCNAPTKIVYVYMPTTGTAYKTLPSLTSLPTDVKTTTTTDGRTVNYVVRVETGTLNRAIYQIAILHDPTKDASPNPFAPLPGWNQKLFYTFGGSATSGYIQGLSTGGTLLDYALSKGFAVASSSLNVFGNNENDVLSAETLTMVKARFIQNYGVPKHTIGNGGSGGAMQQHLIANNYPGLLNGLMPSSSWPELLSIVPQSTDCSLMHRAFDTGTQVWTDAEKAAVSGFAAWGVCDNGTVIPGVTGLDWEHVFSPSWLVPTRLGPAVPNCSVVIPDALIYDPIANPTGARCDVFGANPNLFGIDPTTQASQRPLDNVGVQYGLMAFQSGALSAEKFVQLNELVGGYDRNGAQVAARTAATTASLTLAYEGGRMVDGKNLGALPIIDYRAYGESRPDIHGSIESFKVRARLQTANGTSDNQVIIRAASLPSTLLGELLLQMDQWLANIAADTATYSRPVDKVVKNRPASLTDACYTSAGTKIVEIASVAPFGQCNGLYPPRSTPRLVAGAPLSQDILKCQLKPLVRTDYAQSLSDAQFARLQAIFASGVCDFSKPGVGQVPLKEPWLSYPSPRVLQPMALP